MDLNNHIFLPKEDYYELLAASWAPKTTGDRIATTVQTVIFFAAFSGAAVGGSWGIVKAVNWLEKRRLEREPQKKTDVPFAPETTP